MRDTAISGRPPRRKAILVRAVGCGIVLLPVSAEAAAAPDATVRKLQRQLQELQRQLEERDAINRDLLRRVEEVERRIGEHRDAPAPAQPAAGRSAAAASKPATQSRDAAASAPAARMDGEPAAAPMAQSTPTPESKPSAPGQVTATEEEAERALERTLTATGALLLPYGQIEVEPSFTYTRREDRLGVLTPSGPLEFKVRRNEFEEALGARVGLPLDAQAELRLPYSIVQQEINVGDQGVSQTGSGVGDLSFGLAKTVLREKGWRPDVTARLTWNAPTGESEDNKVPLVSGSGFNELSGELVALKRQDPLAFVLSGSYQKTLNKKNGVSRAISTALCSGRFSPPARKPH